MGPMTPFSGPACLSEELSHIILTSLSPTTLELLLPAAGLQPAVP
jgi:hypothetical protein